MINLVKNKHLIGSKYFDSANRAVTADRNGDHDHFSESHFFLRLNVSSKEDHCHYHEKAITEDGSTDISAISLSDNSRQLFGLFVRLGQLYYLEPDNVEKQSTILSKPKNDCNQPPGTSLDRTIEHKPRVRRSPSRKLNSRVNNDILHEPFQSNTSSLYVELLVVHDHSQYLEYKNNTALIADRTMLIVNIMNAFYRQLNIFISLVGVLLWIEKDEIKLSEDGDATLTNFLKYRHEKLLPRFPHDNAQLITTTSFKNSVVGKALKGSICTREHSGGVNTDHSSSPAVVAVTLAHELGHNFGMEHDDDTKCKCPDEKCIMSASSSSLHPKRWSSCSVDHLDESRKHGLLECLANRPTKLFGPICGNGFVEEGEDCDLGELVPTGGSSKRRKSCPKGQPQCDDDNVVVAHDDQTVNPCCDRNTCKFAKNATCAQGSCCDLATCSIYNKTVSASRVCRPRQSECDFEEVCDGKSEYCPLDVHYHDGIDCVPSAIPDGSSYEIDEDQAGLPSAYLVSSVNRQRAHCYQGKCASHDSQCQLLWGTTGFVSRDICYEQNLNGNTTGHCGYDRRLQTTRYNSCEPEDALCGMLHCMHKQSNGADAKTPGKLEHGFESSSILTVSYYNVSNQAQIYCYGAIVDAGPNVRDPGMAPDGASCGADKMCLKHKCVPLNDVLYADSTWCPSDCNGNGICDNVGRCHCFDGTIGTSCYQLFGSNFHLSVFLYMIFFFVPLVGLLVFAMKRYKSQIKIWWFLHNKNRVLRDKARASHTNQQQHQFQSIRSTAYEAGNQKVSISEPRPLSSNLGQASASVHLPHNYDPFSYDPWAGDETSRQGNSKSVGFRLEPLKTSQQTTTTSSLQTHLQQPSTTSEDPSNSDHQAVALRPVRAAPPPPPPPHKS